MHRRQVQQQPHLREVLQRHHPRRMQYVPPRKESTEPTKPSIVAWTYPVRAKNRASVTPPSFEKDSVTGDFFRQNDDAFCSTLFGDIHHLHGHAIRSIIGGIEVKNLVGTSREYFPQS